MDLSDQDLQEMIILLASATLGRKLGKVKPATPLFSSQGVFDSIALMEFVLRLEDTFGLSIPDQDLDPDIFCSVQTVASYLRVRLKQRG